MALPLYLLFFLSGAAGLVYQLAWSRSLSLVFGGSHLAVTTVLSVFMGGLALGSALLSGRGDRSRRPLRLYGYLELGVAACAILSLGLVKLYPVIYPPLARLAEHDRVWLTGLRVVFAALAMLPPTMLMGATLPVLVRWITAKPERIAGQLSFLYAVNTLGAVAGTLACGFVLLRALGVDATLGVAIATNVAVGLAALLLPERWFGSASAANAAGAPASSRADGPEASGGAVPALSPALRRLVLLGTGVSGFCALGYEVLWTRMFTLVLGTSVYSFALVLVAFLAGIALGSQAFGVAQRWLRSTRASVAAFGVVELAIGVAAVVVTVLMRDLPSHVTRLPDALLDTSGAGFATRHLASFVVAVSFAFVPAFLMGAAFPLAGTLVATGRGATSTAVGETYAYNTLGSILGATVTGFALVPAFGIERSIELLALLNAGIGLLVLASLARAPAVRWAAVATGAAALVALALAPGTLRLWDSKLFAIYQNNRREAFATPELRARMLAASDVPYAFEGVNETIAVIRRRGEQSLVVNGRAEATTGPVDMQFQYALGHVPVLLHPSPRSVFVLGSGAGMTLGAATVHPEVEQVVLAEIEPGVLPATRLFGPYNHDALSSPKLRIVFNDGRNYLMTTRDLFDVVTADPIHPWSGGAAYLYTSEYFASLASHLRPGGIAGQWLPLYELSPTDVKTIVRTFAAHFRHVLLWVTFADTVLIGSDSPFAIDVEDLRRRLAHPEVASDLGRVEMSTAEDFLSYFMFGTDGARAYAEGGLVNTDDNLFLEFSAPQSAGNPLLLAANLEELSRHRESIVPYLEPAAATELASWTAGWQRQDAAGRVWDGVHVLLTSGAVEDPRLQQYMQVLWREHARYAPLRFVQRLQ